MSGLRQKPVTLLPQATRQPDAVAESDIPFNSSQLSPTPSTTSHPVILESSCLVPLVSFFFIYLFRDSGQKSLTCSYCSTPNIPTATPPSPPDLALLSTISPDQPVPRRHHEAFLHRCMSHVLFCMWLYYRLTCLHTRSCEMTASPPSSFAAKETSAASLGSHVTVTMSS